MAFRARRLARGRNKDKLVLGHLLPGRRRRLCMNSSGGGVISDLLLRVRSLFKGVVMGPNLILVTVSRACQCFIGGRSEVSINVNTVQPIRDRFTGYMSSARGTYDVLIPNFRRIFFPVRGGGRLLKGAAGIALSSSSSEEKWVSSISSESAMTSATRCFFGARGGDGTAEVDPSGTSVKSHPGYSPISGWGG
jgi:hypothetical protein